MKKVVRLSESHLNRIVKKILNEEYIGKKGKKRVSKFLHDMVDKYVEEIEDMSEDADNDFFVRDFANWFKNK